MTKYERPYDPIPIPQRDEHDYWAGTTHVPCPCGGTVEWAEAGYSRGYRACLHCRVLYAVRGRGPERALVPQTGYEDEGGRIIIDDAPPGLTLDHLERVSKDYFGGAQVARSLSEIEGGPDRSD